LPVGLPATLARDHCAVRALLQFARVPWAAPQGDDGWAVGDLRYSGFAQVRVGPGADACPSVGAPWVPPRQDLLDGA
jgi:inner membrane protein